MASIDITTQSGAVGNGDLQLQNGAPMDATLRFVTDALNTASPLKLSTSLVQTTSTLKITTNDNPYIDAEDGSGNNRFTVGRATASQQVNVDFASNPAGSTTAVGAIRTYRDGTNLSEAMTFIEDGSVGIGTTAPVGLLDLYKAAAATRLAIRGDAGQNRLISYRTGALQRFGLYVNNTAESGSNAGSNFAIRAYNDAGTLLSTPLFIERSTANVGIGTTTPVSKLDVTGDIRATIGLRIGANADGTTGQFSTDGTDTYLDYQGSLIYRAAASSVERMRLTSAGNVGIGTSSPQKRLHIVDANQTNQSIRFGTESVVPYGEINYTSVGFEFLTLSCKGTASGFGNIVFETGNTLTEKARITADGYLRMAASTGGIQFNGDTAAANALDDYEEGTWTMGVSFGGASVGVTYQFNTGTYTKIGRQVSVNGILSLSSKGSSTGSAAITGLPFTVGGSTGNYSSPSLYFDKITFANQFQGYANVSTTIINLEETTILGVTSAITDVDFANNSNLVVSLTYFV